jgi:hypothetical protein
VRKPFESKADRRSRRAEARDERQLGNTLAAGELAVKEHFAEPDERTPNLRVDTRRPIGPLDWDSVLMSRHLRILPYVVQAALPDAPARPATRL